MVGAPGAPIGSRQLVNFRRSYDRAMSPIQVGVLLGFLSPVYSNPITSACPPPYVPWNLYTLACISVSLLHLLTKRPVQSFGSTDSISGLMTALLVIYHGATCFAIQMALFILSSILSVISYIVFHIDLTVFLILNFPPLVLLLAQLYFIYSRIFKAAVIYPWQYCISLSTINILSYTRWSLAEYTSHNTRFRRRVIQYYFLLFCLSCNISSIVYQIVRICKFIPH